MRQIVLDTETTGLDPVQGHRIIEIGCVEIVNRRITGDHFHQYINPAREIDAGAIEVHGITSEFLSDKPLFADIADEFLAFVKGAELIIHNAPFDIGFIRHELGLLGTVWDKLDPPCEVTDTLQMARLQYPGQRNNLDALCRRLDIDNSQRVLHGALLDAEILADVYLMMTGGQSALVLEHEEKEDKVDGEPSLSLLQDRPPLKVIRANEQELQDHESRLAAINKDSDAGCLWYQYNPVVN